LAVKGVLILAIGISASAWIRAQERSQPDPETEAYFEKWLNSDVTFIISEAEEEVFSDLITPEEKERFIEQFWYRRDPDTKTPINEFKDEHYRRIAFANERFQSGIAG
jgi:hypothetical protein